MVRRLVTNWGNYPSRVANFEEARSVEEIRRAILENGGMIARGNGRCYGDSSLGGRIISTLHLNRIISLDVENGTLDCEAGALLDDILRAVVPNGFFLPVTPGTKFVTAGGAVASDVHGKNHYYDGAFSAHVVEMELIDELGAKILCSRDENSETFWRTCGGMGLTGVIVRVKLKLQKIKTAYLWETTHTAQDLYGLFDLFESNASIPYCIAWIDCSRSRRNFGRSVFTTGEFTNVADLAATRFRDPLKVHGDPRIGIPAMMPKWTINSLSCRSFNSYFYRRARTLSSRRIVHYEDFFYPLDKISNWNRLYGADGFLQYQCVFPEEESLDGLEEMLTALSRANLYSPLAVLKRFGKSDAQALMSFPIEGYSIALDLKRSGATLDLLTKFDEIVLKRNGRVYLAKDATMSSSMFHKSYDQIVTSTKFSSDQSKRLS